jgi:hypothetical protein
VQKSCRPLVITIIGIIQIIMGSALVISLGFGYVSLRNMSGGEQSQSNYILTTVTAAEGMGIVIMGLLLLRGNKWAWMVTMAYFTSGLVAQSFALLGMDLGFGFGLSSYLRASESGDPLGIAIEKDIDYGKHGFNIAIHSTMMFLLLRPSVRNYFMKNMQESINV